MPSCNIDELISDAVDNRFTSVPEGLFNAVEIQLLYSTTGGDDTVGDLVSGACTSEFLCLPEGMVEALETQLLCDALSQ